MNTSKITNGMRFIQRMVFFATSLAEDSLSQSDPEDADGGKHPAESSNCHRVVNDDNSPHNNPTDIVDI